MIIVPVDRAVIADGAEAQHAHSRKQGTHQRRRELLAKESLLGHDDVQPCMASLAQEVDLLLAGSFMLPFATWHVISRAIGTLWHCNVPVRTTGCIMARGVISWSTCALRVP